MTEKSTFTYIKLPDDAPEKPDKAFFDKLAEKLLGGMVGDEDDFPDDLLDGPEEDEEESKD